MATCSFSTLFKGRRKKTKNIIFLKRAHTGSACKRLVYCAQALNERGLDSEKGRENRGGGWREEEDMKRREGIGAVCLLLHWCAVKGITPPPPPTPIYPPARPPPAIPHTEWHTFSSAQSTSARLSRTPPAVYCCVCGRACVSFSKLCAVLQANLFGLSSH